MVDSMQTQTKPNVEANGNGHSKHRTSKSKKKKVSGGNKEPNEKPSLGGTPSVSLDAKDESQVPDPPTALAEETLQEPSKNKNKKRKLKLEESESQSSGPSKNLEAPSVDEPPKKKHKNRTEFADPRVDAKLNSQSKKALEYAFLQMNRPSKWKFNKARQNWLIRHVWDPELISDLYFPFVLKYLADVQGGSRQKLKETCNIYLKPEDRADTLEPSAQVADTPKSSPKSILKKNNDTTTEIKAGPLIDVTSNTIIQAPSTSTTQPDSSPNSGLALSNVRKIRAQSLLDVLGSESHTEN